MSKKTFGFGPSRYDVGDDVVIRRGESRRSEMTGPARNAYVGPLSGARCKVVRSDVEEPLAVDGGKAVRRVTVVPVEGGREGTPTGILSLPVDYVERPRSSSRRRAGGSGIGPGVKHGAGKHKFRLRGGRLVEV